jgi:hypothetical protein
MTTEIMLNNDKAEQANRGGFPSDHEATIDTTTLSSSPPTSYQVSQNSTCDPNSRSPFSSSDYTSVFAAALAEAPGILCAMFMVDRYVTTLSIYLSVYFS